MKGLDSYIQKHGRHFTEKLAYSTIRGRWSAEQIKEDISKKVWYNVTEATFGDILFLVNLAYTFGKCLSLDSKSKCIDFALSVVGNVEYTGTAFDTWLSVMERVGKDFDFKEYIE